MALKSVKIILEKTWEIIEEGNHQSCTACIYNKFELLEKFQNENLMSPLGVHSVSISRGQALEAENFQCQHSLARSRCCSRDKFSQ
jgi:hypothetical protein